MVRLEEMGLTMRMTLRSFAKWVRGILDSEEAYNLPEDVYNDVIPSGVHDFCRFDREY